MAEADEIDREYGPDFDIVALMKESVDPLTGVMRDLKIDDRDLPLAKNYYDFIFNISGPGIAQTPPWSRQMYTLLQFFGEICPRCSNKRWLDVMNIPKNYPAKDLLSDLVLLEHGRCPKCKRSKRNLLRNGRLNWYKEAVLVWGQRSGKSTTLVSGSAYHNHRFLKFPRFSDLVNTMKASTPLSFNFVSLTHGKAMSVMWNPFLLEIQDNEWYQQYFEMLDHYGAKYGIELYELKKEFLKFHSKNLHLAPMPPNKSTLRGETRYGAGMDELGLFALPSGNDEEDEQNERANADEAHKSLTNSLVTVQSAATRILEEQRIMHVPTGIMMGVSSPMSERDKVMRLLRDSQGEEGSKMIFGSQLPTWEVNPDLERTSDMIRLAFEKNAAKAERDFGANPPRIANPFMSTSVLRNGAFAGRPSSHILEYDFKGGVTSGKLRKRFSVQEPTVMSVDAGEVDNSFAITIFSLDPETGRTICNTVLELMPARGRRISQTRVYNNILKPLALDNNVVAFFADRWNSAHMLERLKEEVPSIQIAQQITPKRKDFDTMQSMIEDGLLIFPKPELKIETFIDYSPENYRQYFVNKPVAHLAHQFGTIQDAGPKRCPEKGHGYTDDLVRAAVLGATKIHLPKVLKALKEARLHRRSDNSGSTGIVVLGRSY